ncbi:hypothetical protein Y032_0037g3492 [Ancylostoma ceylanicum]|uniref:Uncharacterized protein n=1 Tax=Ancylostoma ceylanicum TaxID=53326 RepID=A0A016UKE4_9BILA|nr:hypothetical protein Y032_0037g3492 [Ancylostoma ceylanicum]
MFDNFVDEGSRKNRQTHSQPNEVLFNSREEQGIASLKNSGEVTFSEIQEAEGSNVLKFGVQRVNYQNHRNF